ncbi:hypothetical protein BDN72DRAFT_965716 [Pluteus cervinus]|uniref:Uncharacterized protein n=1 Tax=Pluteus cervinus TaxID=181527 RepID=A0ACD3A3R7_9AGAR|nr:hypothetical protein BDN72DRAFT_965716 [Pluteus cervinus]
MSNKSTRFSSKSLHSRLSSLHRPRQPSTAGLPRSQPTAPRSHRHSRSESPPADDHLSGSDDGSIYMGDRPTSPIGPDDVAELSQSFSESHLDRDPTPDPDEQNSSPSPPPPSRSRSRPHSQTTGTQPTKPPRSGASQALDLALERLRTSRKEEKATRSWFSALPPCIPSTTQGTVLAKAKEEVNNGLKRKGKQPAGNRRSKKPVADPDLFRVASILFFPCGISPITPDSDDEGTAGLEQYALNGDARMPNKPALRQMRLDGLCDQHPEGIELRKSWSFQDVRQFLKFRFPTIFQQIDTNLDSVLCGDVDCPDLGPGWVLCYRESGRSPISVVPNIQYPTGNDLYEYSYHVSGRRTFADHYLILATRLPETQSTNPIAQGRTSKKRRASVISLSTDPEDVQPPQKAYQTRAVVNSRKASQPSRSTARVVPADSTTEAEPIPSGSNQTITDTDLDDDMFVAEALSQSTPSSPTPAFNSSFIASYSVDPKHDNPWLRTGPPALPSMD